MFAKYFKYIVSIITFYFTTISICLWRGFFLSPTGAEKLGVACGILWDPVGANSTRHQDVSQLRWFAFSCVVWILGKQTSEGRERSMYVCIYLKKIYIINYNL